MPNPDSGNLPSAFGNKGKSFVRKPSGSVGFVEKTANWPGLPGKPGPNRSAGIKKVRTHPKSIGL